MAEVRFLPPAAKYLKTIKDKRLKALYQEDIRRNDFPALNLEIRTK